jgi:hypothetical protein
LPVATRTQLEIDFQLFESEWGVDILAVVDTIIVSGALCNILAHGECVSWNFVNFFKEKFWSNTHAPF